MSWPEIGAVAMTLIFVMDPLGNIPVFNSVLAPFDKKRRARIIARELVIALGLLLSFLFAGTRILAFLGLSQSSLSLAGGILLFIISLRLIYPAPARADSEVERPVEEPFIVPLAMPLIAGPSTIATLLLLSSAEPDRVWEWCAALGIAWLVTTAILASSPLIMSVLGARGLRAVERLMGMLLLLLAVQMFLNGLADFVAGLERVG